MRSLPPIAERPLTLVILLLSGAGVGAFLLPEGGGSGPGPTFPAAALDPSAAHATAGVSAGPEVQAAFDERVRDLRAVVAARPADRTPLLELARLLHDGHRIREAIPLYERALALDSTDAQAHYDLAAAHGEVGDWRAARAVLEAHVWRAPADAVALYDLGMVDANLGDRDGARAWLVRARAVDGADDQVLALIDAALARLAGASPGDTRAR